MNPSDPIYTLRHAFEADPICSCIGFAGLRETIPQLEPGLYMIRIEWLEVGIAERHADGGWLVDLIDGTRAEPA
jgi:predicted DNA-binding protein (MmcQ/YjbR family)